MEIVQCDCVSSLSCVDEDILMLLINYVVSAVAKLLHLMII